MAWFRPAEDVDAAALDVLDRVLEKPCHEYLREFGIRLMFRSDTPKNRGQETWATAKRASAFERALAPTTACYVIVSAPIWQVLSDHQKEALLDHELRHFGLNEDDELVMVGHDLEEFVATWNTYGNWRPSLEQAAGQLRLIDEGVTRLSAVGG